MSQTNCGFHDTPGGVSGSDLLTAYGPTLLVDIGFGPDFSPSAAHIAPAPGITGIEALVDTGAGESCIDNSLAARLNLSIVDRRMVSGIHGSRLSNMYLAQVRVPALDFTIWGAFTGVDLLAGGCKHSVLIGRTFLARFTMVYDGLTGAVTISSP